MVRIYKVSQRRNKIFTRSNRTKLWGEEDQSERLIKRNLFFPWKWPFLENIEYCLLSFIKNSFPSLFRPKMRKKKKRKQLTKHTCGMVGRCYSEISGAISAISGPEEYLKNKERESNPKTTLTAKRAYADAPELIMSYSTHVCFSI